jgi:hypothetical protein
MAGPGEPGGDVLGVAVEEATAVRVGDDVDHLRQVNHHQPPVMDQQVVRGQVAVREAEAGESGHGLDQLAPEAGEFGRPGAGLGEARRAGAVRLADELKQHLGAHDLHRVRDRHPRAVELAQRGELRVRPLAGDRLPAERGPVRGGAGRPAVASPTALEVSGVPVELPVRGVPVAFGGEQAGPVCPWHAPAEEKYVGFFSRLEDAQFVVDRGEVGDQPRRERLRAALQRRYLIPGRPAIAFRQAVGRVAFVGPGEPSQLPGALYVGGLVIVRLIELMLPLSPGAADPAECRVVGICAVAHQRCSSGGLWSGQAEGNP